MRPISRMCGRTRAPRQEDTTDACLNKLIEFTPLTITHKRISVYVFCYVVRRIIASRHVAMQYCQHSTHLWPVMYTKRTHVASIDASTHNASSSDCHEQPHTHATLNAPFNAGLATAKSENTNTDRHTYTPPQRTINKQ